MSAATRSFDPLPALLGQGAAWERARAAARELALHHAVLLSGPRGCGKTLAARWLARELLCGGRDDDAAEVRRVGRASHPDLHVVTRPEDRQDVPVERVRELQAALERSAVEARARVAIVDPADRLNEQGQNALLKTLEEPGPATFLILVTSRPEALLETIRSRVFPLRLVPLDDATAERVLEVPPGTDPERLRGALREARGCVGQAERALTAERVAVDQRLVRFLAEADDDAASAQRDLLRGSSGRTATEERLGTVFAALRARLREGVETGLAAEGGPLYAAAALNWSLAALDAVLAAEGDLALGIPPAQVLEGLLLELRDPRTRA